MSAPPSIQEAMRAEDRPAAEDSSADNTIAATAEAEIAAAEANLSALHALKSGLARDLEASAALLPTLQ